jgi:HTH-type transcriptional regulator / antitoxin HigA
MTTRDKFEPDWASPPGETILDILRERSISHSDFARSLGETHAGVNALLRGHVELTTQHAKKLEVLFGASYTFWLNREMQYRQDIIRVKNEELNSMTLQWLNDLPLKDMVKFGWLKVSGKSKPTLTECLKFFGCSSVTEWRLGYQTQLEIAAFRKSPSFEQKPLAVAAWLRKGEVEGLAQECSNWNSERFQTSLAQIRLLTRKKMPADFLPDLRKICAESGVALVVARAPSGCRASGATRFITATKALILLSFRHLTDDHFWFTFFHEAGHVLLHKQDELFIDELNAENTKEEEEANAFATRTLIPDQFKVRLQALSLTPREILRFAKETQVSPGIVIGQLQNSGRIRHDRFNAFKQRYLWEDIDKYLSASLPGEP